jgi:hypothetical protein
MSYSYCFVSYLTQGNTFEQLHDQQLLGRENPAGIDALLGIVDERLARYAKFQRSR